MVATLTAVTAGQAAYWLVRAPTEVAKTAAQVSLRANEASGDSSSTQGAGSSAQESEDEERQGTNVIVTAARQLQTAFGAYPVLALTDLVVIPVRVFLFLLLRSSPLVLMGLERTLAIPPGFGSDLVLYILASLLANGACTPLEVVRTRLLLQRSGRATTSYLGILDALLTVADQEGAAGLWAGLRARLVWNGLWAGAVLGVQRFYYADFQIFFLDVVDDIARAAIG